MRKDPQATGPLHGGVTIGRLMAGVDYSRPLRPKWSGTAGISFQVRVSFLVQILDRLISLVLVSVISIKLLHRNLMFWENTNSFPASWSSRWTWTSESCGHVWRASYIQVIALVLPKVMSKIVCVHLSLLGLHWEVYTCNCLFFVLYVPIYLTWLYVPCSGRAYDDMLVAKLETVYTDPGDNDSSQVRSCWTSKTNQAFF